MNPEALAALRSYLHFWTRFRREVNSGTIKADSGIHWPHVGAESVVVCDFASKQAALHRADAMILEIELQLIALEPEQGEDPAPTPTHPCQHTPSPNP